MQPFARSLARSHALPLTITTQRTDVTRRARLVLCATAMMFTCALSVSAAQAQSEAKEPPYKMQDGKVDESTYLGWRAFHSACHACHGVGAVGTSVAPNLVERIERLSAREFAVKVLTSYRISVPSSELSGEDPTALRAQIVEEVLRRESGELIMPAWEEDANIRPHVLDLYAYLRARADGLAPGEPEQLAD